jgi:TonB-linked SusC/RagA family outer membrane protein
MHYHSKNLQAIKLFLVMLLSFISLSAVAQDNLISGTVTDYEGEPCIGATVKSSKGVTVACDMNGKYSISAAPGQDVTVTFLGCKPQTFKVKKGTKTYNLQMESTSEVLNDVVVVGYNTQKRINLTGSVATVNAEKIAGRPQTSASAMLQGMAPGVTVTTQSGAPGDNGGSIRIRGVNSFGGSSTSPLILVDGIESSMDAIDPTTIESISILKDAASASIYGSRAANGVILVTTKRAGEEKFTLSYSTHLDWQSATRLPKSVNAVQYRELLNVMAVNDGKSPTFDEESMELYRLNMGKDNDLYPNIDWQKTLLTGSGFANTHTVTMTASSERIKTFNSFGYTNQEGIIKHANYERYNYRTNTDIVYNDKLSLRLDGVFSHGNRVYPAYQTSVFQQMNMRPTDTPVLWENGNYNGVGYQGNNPLAALNEGGTYNTKSLRLEGSAALTFKPVKWLSIEGRYAPRYATTNKHNYKRVLTTYTDAEGLSTMRGSVDKDQLTVSNSRSFYGNYSAIVRTDNTFGRHNVKLMLGAERTTYQNDEFSAYREGFDFPEYDQLDAGSLLNLTNGGSTQGWALQSYFGRANYNYHNRYLLEANLRIDGSSRFIKSRRWGYFPSFSAAWRISQESFFEPIADKLTSLKIRGSWGKLGNQNLAGSGSASIYPFSQNLAVGSVAMGSNIYPIATLNTLANPDITWEKTAGIDFGFDATLFGDFNITADWYLKKTSDILMTLDISPTIGLNAPYQNAGEVRNMGWEISLGYAKKFGDWMVTANANLSDVYNKITNMNGKTSTSGVMRNEQGHSIASIYALKSLGYIQTQEQADWVNANCPQFNETVHPGDLRYADINGDGIISDADKTIIGSTVPRYTFSFDASVSFKGIRLSAMFQGVGKVDGYLNTYYVIPNDQGGTFHVKDLDYWTPENTNAQTPRLTTATNNWKDSSFWKRSGSYLRLKNIQLGYDIPRAWLKKLGVKSLYIYGSGENLFTITKFWDGYDPEVNYGGSSGSNYDTVSLGTANNYPQVKTYSVGLNLKF